MTTQHDWSTHELGDLFSFANGINADKSAYGAGTPFINVLEVITNQALSEADIPGQVTLPKKVLDRYRVKTGDVLFNRTSETQDDVGLSSVYVGDGPVVFGGFVLRAQPRTKDLDTGYARYRLRSADVRRQIVARGQGGIRANVGQRDLKTVKVTLPALAEQKRVAAALDDVSDLAEALAQLIAKKRDVKQGMMQELLTGRTRLPGCSGQWSEALISELLEFKNGLNKGSEYFGHGTPIVNFMDVMRSPVLTTESIMGLVSVSRDEVARFSARRGDMFFTRTSESVDEIGTAAVLAEDIPNAVFSGFILRGRPIAPINTTFLAYQFQLPSTRRQVIATASYTTRALTNGGSLGRVKVLLPSPEEQAALVTVMTDLDAEIAALERRLEVARTVKTGMMQELLTGRTRLPVEDAS